MADGGVSTYIMLITALLVSSSVSAVLIQEWSSTSRVIQQQQRGMQFSEELGIDFAGDPMNVHIDRTTTPDEITFYVLKLVNIEWMKIKWKFSSMARLFRMQEYQHPL